MKSLHILYATMLTSLLSLTALTACQSDDDAEAGKQIQGGYVMLRIGVADDVKATRAGETRATWNDDNAESTTDRSEMMYNWTVLLCDASGTIKYVYTGTPPNGHDTNDNAEIDEVTGVIKVGSAIAAGVYTAYSFANISSTNLATLLGVSSLSAGQTISNIDDKTVTINANLKTTTDIVADNAFGLGSKGIPMSNKQTITVTGAESEANPQIIDLIVVRMVAKLEFVFFNNTAVPAENGEDFTVKSVSISDITKGTANNLKLLPNLNNNGNGHENEMTFTHGDIKPNLNTGVTTEEVKYAPTTALTVASSDTYEIGKLQSNSTYAKKFTFYVNETQLATGKQFELNVELNNGDYRYALVSTGNNSGLTVGKTGGGNNEDPTTTPVSETKRSDDWTYIARNDYRVIPIVLDNYRLELVPYDFPAIGVYPASVKTIDANTNLHEILFHDYGHFHLVPHVYRGAAWAGTENNTAAYPWAGKDITFSATKGNFSNTVWTLDKTGTTAVAADWTNAFSSFTTTGTGTTLAKDAELTIELNSGTTKFYGAPNATGLPANNVYPTALPVYGTNFDAEVTHTADGKTYSQGDFPMLDAVTLWKPKTDDAYRPYIFGQIAPQEDNADKTVYHEFRVNVYVQGESVARLLIYRFYMHLKQDFGLARRYAAARPTCRLHCHE
ncbi:MAG: hypothetical protein IJ892_10035 [Prevotella sp.]|nr:hypothetical protein [Prevotella sp.]